MRNNLKEIWASGRPAINGWLSIANSFSAEMMAEQGYDSLTIDIQHGTAEIASVLPIFQAMRASGVVPLARVPWLDPASIMKVLDIGAMGIICPMVNNAQQAAEFVKYTRYPPMGERSYGPTRAAIGVENYHLKANAEVLAFAMIETAEAFDNLDEIISTPGLSGIYVGPSDLTLSTQDGRLPSDMGMEEDALDQMLQKIANACNAKGVKAGIHCTTPEHAAKAIQWGYCLTTVATDLRLMVAGAAASVKQWRALTAPAPQKSG